MDYIVIPIVKFLEWTFGILESLGNFPNWSFIVIGFVGLFYWLWLQGKYNRQAAANGTIK
ncbi:MAG: hypothetical protein ACHQF2_04070 [Flavobacteriales bacterium]